MTMNPDPLEVWKAAMTQWCYGMPDALSPSFGDDQAAAAVIAQHYAPLLAKVTDLEALVGELGEALGEFVTAIETGDFYKPLCCGGGSDCNCRGSSNGDLLMHDARDTLAKLEKARG